MKIKAFFGLKSTQGLIPVEEINLGTYKGSFAVGYRGRLFVCEQGYGMWSIRPEKGDIDTIDLLDQLKIIRKGDELKVLRNGMRIPFCDINELYVYK